MFKKEKQNNLTGMYIYNLGIVMKYFQPALGLYPKTKKKKEK